MSDGTNFDTGSFATEAKVATLPSSIVESTQGSNSNAEKQADDSSVQTASTPAILVVATACKPNGRDPHSVIEFEDRSGRRVRRLVPVQAFTSVKRARTLLIRAGVPPTVASDDAAVAALVDAHPPATGLYAVPRGWFHGCDIGAAYRHRDTVFSSSGPIAVYADGPIPELPEGGDIGKLIEALTVDRSTSAAILMAAHLASPLVQLLGCNRIVIVASGVSHLDVQRLITLAESAFGTMPIALYGAGKDTDGALVDLMKVNSRSEAFAHARAVLKARTIASRRGSRASRMSAPVTLILATEADSPGDLASPTPPPGCIEIHLDACGPDTPNEAAQASADATVCFHANVAETYIEAVLREQGEIIRYAETRLPKFFERYLGIVHGLQHVDAVSAALHSFSLLRFALTCGRELKIIPWSSDSAHTMMDACMSHWIDHRRQREAAFDRHVIDAVKKLAAPDSPNRLAKSDGRGVRFKTISGRELLLIEPDTFKAAVIGHHDKVLVLETLQRYKLLVTNCDGNQYQARIDDGRPRFYAVDTATLALRKSLSDRA